MARSDDENGGHDWRKKSKDGRAAYEQQSQQEQQAREKSERSRALWQIAEEQSLQARERYLQRQQADQHLHELQEQRNDRHGRERKRYRSTIGRFQRCSVKQHKRDQVQWQRE